MYHLLITIFSLLLACASFAEGAKDQSNIRNVKVEVTEKGFTPSRIPVRKGESLVLSVTRKTDKTCVTSLKHHGDKKEVPLPLNREIQFKVNIDNNQREVSLLCGMDMRAGIVEVL